MIIKPLRPLILPLLLIVFIIALASFLPVFTKLDESLIAMTQALPQQWRGVFEIITILGDHWLLFCIAIIVAAVEFYRGRRIRSLVITLSLISLPLFYLIKQTVVRARPVNEFIAEQGLSGYSFPSGHATGSATIYGMIAFLAYSHLKGIWKYTVTGLCVVLIVAIGFSRVYLGAHFPTDVLAGWLLALIIISLLRSLSLYLAKKSNVPDKEAMRDTTEPIS